jgi:predicted GH43/DUF377 family glycosyl hydrolase
MHLTDHIILDPKDSYETNYIGGGPSIETPCGWLLIYHGVQETTTEGVHAKAASIWKEMELSRLPYTHQQKKWEKRVL